MFISVEWIILLVFLVGLAIRFTWWKEAKKVFEFKNTISILFKKGDAKKYFHFTEQDINDFYYDSMGNDSDKENEKAKIVWKEGSEGGGSRCL